MHMKRRVPMPCNDSSNGSSSLIQFSISYQKKKRRKVRMNRIKSCDIILSVLQSVFMEKQKKKVIIGIFVHAF